MVKKTASLAGKRVYEKRFTANARTGIMLKHNAEVVQKGWMSIAIWKNARFTQLYLYLSKREGGRSYWIVKSTDRKRVHIVCSDRLQCIRFSTWRAYFMRAADYEKVKESLIAAKFV
jgi:hypothetical protein